MADVSEQEKAAEKARVAAHQKSATADRAREEARREARGKLAKSQESLIVHGPAKS